MPTEAASLRQELRQAGFASSAIDAVWPGWWSKEAETSFSAMAELRFTVARRLGLSPKSLFDGPPRFVWQDAAKFKNLGTTTQDEATLLTSFGAAVGRYTLAALPDQDQFRQVDALELRQAILSSSPFVGLSELLAFCWGIGIPVVQLHIFPLDRKKMHALTARLVDRFAILVGRESSFPAQIAYFIAHEIGHIMLGHIERGGAILEFGDPIKANHPDDEEAAADRYALELLTGDPDGEVVANISRFTATQLAVAASNASTMVKVDPGILALCLAHATGRWRQGYGALRLISPESVNVGELLNQLAVTQLDLDLLTLDGQDYLQEVLNV
jgi:hypothetical protein